MKQLPSLLTFCLVCLVFFVPSVVDAQNLVTCAGTDAAGGECNFCTLAQMIKRIVDFIIVILILVSVIMLAVTGIQMAYMAAGNGDALSVLKDRMVNIVIGFFLIIASWTLIDTLIKVLVADTPENSSIMSWETFGSSLDELCGKQAVPEVLDFFNREGADATDPAAASVTPPAGTTVNGMNEQSALDALGIDTLEVVGPGEACPAGTNFCVKSTEKCADKSNSKCTSFEGLQPITAARTRELQSAVGTQLVITGLTETGHSNKSTYSHGNGYKVDLRTTPELNNYIVNNFTSIGGSKWKDENGNIYYRHGSGSNDHWDVTYTN